MSYFQSVWLTFSDGTKAGFTGAATIFPGDSRAIVDVSFTPPQKLPPGYSFEQIDPPRPLHRCNECRDGRCWNCAGPNGCECPKCRKLKQSN